MFISMLQVVVLLVGTNNVSHKPDQIADGIISIAQAVRSKLEEAHIVLMVSTSAQVSS